MISILESKKNHAMLANKNLKNDIRYDILLSIKNLKVKI